MVTKMNIAYILHTTGPNDGATKALLTLLPKLCKQGVTPYFIVPNKKGIYTTLKEQYNNVFATTYRTSCYPYHRNLKEKVLYIPRLIVRRLAERLAISKTTKYLRDKNIDIIHTNVSVIDLGFHVAQKLQRPHIYHIREYAEFIGYQRFPSKKDFLAKLSLPKSYSITITKDIQKYYKQNHNPNSVVIYDCIKMTKEPVINHKKEKYFLFAGRIQPAKGLDLIIEAYILASYNKLTILPLYIAGAFANKDYKYKIKKMIKKHHLESCIHFLGERQDIAQLMQKANAIIIATKHEGFGLCMAEAMQNKCLVIGRNTAGTKEQFDNGFSIEKREIGIRYSSSTELSKILTEITRHAKDYSETIKCAYEAITTLYTEDKCTKRVLALYQKCIKQNKSRINLLDFLQVHSNNINN